jgi:hypothetical protein
MTSIYPPDSKVCHSVRACIDRVIEAAPDGSIFVESGCYQGNSTKHWIEKLLASGKKFKFYGIDNYKLDNVTERFDSIDENYKFFCENIGEELLKHAEIIKSDSLEAIKLFEDDSVFFVFLDDSHVYDHVVKQIGLWLPKMKDFSIMAGDDYYSPEVQSAVAQHFKKKDVESLDNNAGFLVTNPKQK